MYWDTRYCKEYEYGGCEFGGNNYTPETAVIILQRKIYELDDRLEKMEKENQELKARINLMTNNDSEVK